MLEDSRLLRSQQIEQVVFFQRAQWGRFLFRAFWLLVLCGCAAAQPTKAPMKRLLAIGASKGYQHDSISHALAVYEHLGRETGLWETFIRTDTQLITKKKLGLNAKNLDYFDTVYFYTTGELDMDQEQKAALLSFVKEDGKGFIAGHSAADTFAQWPEYGEMLGARYDSHPWDQQVKIRVEDRNFPAMTHFPPSIELSDEIYQFKDWFRDKVRVLLSLDPQSVDLNVKAVRRTDKDFALVWVKKYGKGRVFFNALGHRDDIYDRPDIQKMMLESVKWVMGLTDADVAPHAKP